MKQLNSFLFISVSLVLECYVESFSSTLSLPAHNHQIAWKSKNRAETRRRGTGPPQLASGFLKPSCTSSKKTTKDRTFLFSSVENEEDLSNSVSFFDRASYIDEKAKIISEDTEFDLIVIGSGNGACGFLAECLKYAPSDHKILVLEQGKNFFYTSDVTHQNGWSKSYASGKIFKLHNARTSDGRPIITGRANTMGGGGSINYTMIHETSKWLAENIGQKADYFDGIKLELNSKFKRPDPFTTQTPFSKIIKEKALMPGTGDHPRVPYLPPAQDDFIGRIPNLQVDLDKFPTDDAKQFYIFPTQFNAYGQRTNSGVSLVDWDRITLRCNREVKELCMDKKTLSRCEGVKVKNGNTNEEEHYRVKEGGRVVLASGSQSPRLLMQTPGVNSNDKIGKRVNDHICMPLGIYVVPKSEKALIGGSDAYEAVFASMVVDTGTEGDVESGKKEVVFFDFFSGEVERLLYLVSSLYLCYIPFNSLKRLMGKNPILFTFLSNTVRVLLTVLVYIYKLLQGGLNVIRGRPFSESEFVITTSLVKFNCVTEGQYEMEDDQITLKFFEDKKDAKIAEEAIKENLDFLGSLGAKPFFLLRILFQLITKIPYEEKEVERYVKHFSRKTLLSEQHLAGGCIFGDVIDKGGSNPSDTGKVIGSENIHVADLSAVPLPRCSTQMTAYLVGHHVGKQLYGPK